MCVCVRLYEQPIQLLQLNINAIILFPFYEIQNVLL